MLVCGLIGAGIVVVRRKRNKKQQRERGSRKRGEAGQSLHNNKQQQRQVVHAYQSPEADGSSNSADPSSAGSSSKGSTISRSYAYSSVFLLLSLALAVYTSAVLAMRGQQDLAAVAAVTWLLAAPAVLSLGRRRQAALSSSSSSAAGVDAQGADATMVITEAEPPTKILADFHGTWIKVGMEASTHTHTESKGNRYSNEHAREAEGGCAYTACCVGTCCGSTQTHTPNTNTYYTHLNQSMNQSPLTPPSIHHPLLNQTGCGGL